LDAILKERARKNIKKAKGARIRKQSSDSLTISTGNGREEARVKGGGQHLNQKGEGICAEITTKHDVNQKKRRGKKEKAWCRRSSRMMGGGVQFRKSVTKSIGRLYS